MLRLRALESGAAVTPTPQDKGPVVTNITPDPAVPPSEMPAWVAIQAPHILLSKRSFAFYAAARMSSTKSAVRNQMGELPS